MHSPGRDMEELRRLLEKGSVQRAYRGLLSYMRELRIHFENRIAGATVSGLYQGAMDFTFFAIVTPSLKPHQLKIAILFNYEAFRFEAWLAGRNRQVQRRYWELLKDRSWPGYRVATPGKGVDSILECDLAAELDLDDPETLTATLEANALAFIDTVEASLASSGNAD